MGIDTYLLSRQEGAFPAGNEPLLMEALCQANSFCISQKKEFQLINSHENQGPFVLGNHPKATITFSCKDSPI